MSTGRRLTPRHDRGANLVEMALVTILLLIILAGVVDIGRAFYAYVTITNASREGARYASHFPHDTSGIVVAVEQELSGTAVDPSLVSTSWPVLETSPGGTVMIQVEYPFATMMSGLTGIGTITLRGATEMIVFGLDT